MEAVRALHLLCPSDIDFAAELQNLINISRPETLPDPISRSEWDSFLADLPSPTTFEIHSDAFCKGRSVPWTWRFDESAGRVEIELRTQMKLTISEKEISSPLLRGEWWTPISDLDVVPLGQKMKITFRPEARGPLLIRSGDVIDPHSMFFLGLFAMHVKADPKFFFGWMTMAALAGEPSAQHWLGRKLLEEERPESVHWLARSVLEHADGESTVTLCWLLWGGPKEVRNELLAESLLISEANRGNGAAVSQLGWLYMNGCGEVEKQEVLGRKLLQIAAGPFGYKDAQEKLKQIESEPTILDYSMVLGLGVCVAVGGLWVLRKFFRRA
jgi:hypothetical protein